jgi:multicomponent Na+:H+ antiporter subunit E
MAAVRLAKLGASMIATLSVLWFVLSGFTTPLMLSLGAASVIFVFLLSVRMKVLDEEGLPIYVHEWSLAKYVVWLAWEVVKANIDVTRIILSRHLNLQPIVVRLPARQQTVVGRVIYANSITLTPGTVSIELGEDFVDVHALTQAGVSDLETSDMHDRVCEVEVIENV